MARHAAASFACILASALVVTIDAPVRADTPAPPWTDAGDVPLAAWAHSVVARRLDRAHPGDMILYEGPGRDTGRRGVTAPGATLPIFAAKRGGGCAGRWWLVGPYAWVCSDAADLAAEEPFAPERTAYDDGLPAHYYFVARDGTSAYASLQSAEEGTPDHDLEGGWGIAVVEERVVRGERWGRTSKGLWVAMRDLGAARPSLFHGEQIDADALDVAWVVSERANVLDSPRGGKKVDALPRFTLVHARVQGSMLQIGDKRFARPDDFARPEVSAPPPEVTRTGERWIDVDRKTQTLVAYEGARPVFATLVSTGRGGPGSGNDTPPGVHRIWVKLLASDMDNVENGDVESHYSLGDVPHVQFFDKTVALHGTYWHRDFGHVKSHGCVNLAPLDAQWLFAFTGPRVPAGWVASYPTPTDEGTVVRVR